jgi:transcriptional regulator with XRE-family HTH domain
MNIGETIKTERKKKNITQKELAQKINKSERMVQKYENGEVTPSIEVLNQIAAELGVFIFSFADNKTSSKNDNNYNSREYYLDQYLSTLGYKITGDLGEGDLFLESQEGTYEINMNDIEDLRSSTQSFIEYKLHDITKKSRKIGK